MSKCKAAAASAAAAVKPQHHFIFQCGARLFYVFYFHQIKATWRWQFALIIVQNLLFLLFVGETVLQMHSLLIELFRM